MKRGLKNRLRDGEAFDRLVEEHYDDVLGVSRFAVNRRLNRALAELRRGLEGKDEA